MDVMSLLNTPSEAAQQPPGAEGSKMPTRSRTPWDAGGYSLPIHTHMQESFTNLVLSTRPPMDSSPNQKMHKLSDSHSSLSSLASSHSASHSRFSSSSTVNSLHPIGYFNTHGIFSPTETDPRSSKASKVCSSPVSPLSGRSTLYASSPSENFSDLPLAIESRFREASWAESVDHMLAKGETMKNRPATQAKKRRGSCSSRGSPRPASPSDAILIKRTTPPMTPLISQPSDLMVVEDCEKNQLPQKNANIRSVPEQQNDRLFTLTKGHKRATSAPDFPGVSEEPVQNQSSSSASPAQMAGLTPPSSQHPNVSSPGDAMIFTAPNTPPGTASPSTDRKPCCMYIADCDTGSQLRKAVSHIFGRNKMCTRRIPTHVWVWYCRKHYQRARYRNSKEWARTLQYDLVSRQIKRLQEWSEENRSIGEGGIVKDYRLAVRKREQRRLDAQKPKAEREFSDEEGDEPNEAEGDAPSVTAVPKWLLDLSGRSHDSGRIVEIINNIQVDLANGTLSAWPDIEILPNIVLEQDEPEGSRSYARRKVPTAAHRRSQSMGSSMRNGDYSAGQQIPLPETWPLPGPGLQGVHAQKRKRYDDLAEDFAGSASPQTQRLRVSEPPMSAERPDQFSAHLPTFQDIAERPGRGLCFKGNETHRGRYSTSPNLCNSPLPAPTAQRRNVQSAAVHLDSSIPRPDGTHPESHSGMHKRSCSDMSTLHKSRLPYPPPATYRDQASGPQRYVEVASPHNFSSQSLSSSASPVGIQGLRPSLHSRHLSTPTATPSSSMSQHTPRSAYGPRRALPSSQPAPTRHVTESMQAQSVYSSRR